MKLLLYKKDWLVSVFFLSINVSLVCPILIAQHAEYTFDHINTNDGLPNGDVNDMLQDQDGFIWLCTWDGLIRYDGYNFLRFKPSIHDKNSISSKLLKNGFFPMIKV